MHPSATAGETTGGTGAPPAVTVPPAVTPRPSSALPSSAPGVSSALPSSAPGQVWVLGVGVTWPGVR
eukprot:scaffold41709_cov58-Phaeocystis_antarctica.AAC.2